MHEMTCNLCGKQCAMGLVSGVLYSACQYCSQAHVPDANIIIKLDSNTINYGTSALKRDFVALALASQLVYNNWEQIVDRVHVSEQ